MPFASKRGGITMARGGRADAGRPSRTHTGHSTPPSCSVATGQGSAAEDTDQAARALREEGATADVTPSLQEDIGTEWTCANYPLHWLNHDAIREV